jgi:hypothetical protein
MTLPQLNIGEQDAIKLFKIVDFARMEAGNTI